MKAWCISRLAVFNFLLVATWGILADPELRRTRLGARTWEMRQDMSEIFYTKYCSATFAYHCLFHRPFGYVRTCPSTIHFLLGDLF